jgi:hypothetical protein
MRMDLFRMESRHLLWCQNFVTFLHLPNKERMMKNSSIAWRATGNNKYGMALTWRKMKMMKEE